MRFAVSNDQYTNFVLINIITHRLPLGARRIQVQFAGAQKTRHGGQCCRVLHCVRTRIEHFDLDNVVVRFSRSSVRSATSSVDQTRRGLRLPGGQSCRLCC